MFEKEAEEFERKTQKKYIEAQENGYMPSLWANIGNIWQDGAEFGYNKAKEEIREELLELKADSFDAGMFLRVDETLRKLGIKED